MKYFVILVLFCVAARAQDALTLEAIAADRSLWPSEVMVTVDHQMPVVIDGKVAKTLKFGPGKIYGVKEISAKGVSVASLGSPMIFGTEDTDVLARAENIRAQKIALAAATPTPSPTPNAKRVTRKYFRNPVPSIELPEGFKKVNLPLEVPSGKIFAFAKEGPENSGPILMVGLIDARAGATKTADEALSEFQMVGKFLKDYKVTGVVDSSLGGMPAREQTFLAQTPDGKGVSGQTVVATDGSYVYWAQMFDEQAGKAFAGMGDVLNTLKWVDEPPQAPAASKPTPKPVAAATPEPPKSLLSRLSQALTGGGGAPSANNAVAGKLEDQLIRLDGGNFESYDSARLADKKYIGVYFSAAWCPPCRQFTPKLVEWYRMHRERFDNFEIVFVSRDRDEDEMASYMAGYRMEWPAVQYSRAQNSPFEKYSGRGIPCLVVLDESGSVVAHSYESGQYVGPMAPLEKLTRLIEE